MQGRNQTVQDCAQMSIQFRITYSLIRELHLAVYSNTGAHFMLKSLVPECVVLVSLDADVYPIYLAVEKELGVNRDHANKNERAALFAHCFMCHSAVL
eukprot:2460-Heterococcus_DN1.PRE.3